MDPSTTDQTVDLLRSAARGLVEGRSYADLSQSGKDLAAAAQQVGVNRWPRFLGSASAHAVEAVSRGEVPGVTKVSADTATDIVGLIVLGLLAIMYATRQSTPPGREQSFAGAAGPTIMRQDEAKKADQRAAQPAPAVKGNDSSTADLAKAGDASLSEDRKKYILDGKGSGGGHGSGRSSPDKSEFPPNWSDDKTIKAIEDVANDPSSARAPGEGGRTKVTGTRDGVDIEVIIGRDRKAIITAYPTNTPRNKGK